VEAEYVYKADRNIVFEVTYCYGVKVIRRCGDAAICNSVYMAMRRTVSPVLR
jgi:hypothetical protein